MNLRLSEEIAAALRRAARQRGVSQQEVVRDALTAYLGLGAPDRSDRERLVDSGLVRAPTPFRDVEPSIVLSPGSGSADLLDRADRL